MAGKHMESRNRKQDKGNTNKLATGRMKKGRKAQDKMDRLSSNGSKRNISERLEGDVKR